MALTVTATITLTLTDAQQAALQTDLTFEGCPPGPLAATLQAALAAGAISGADITNYANFLLEWPGINDPAQRVPHGTPTGPGQVVCTPDGRGYVYPNTDDAVWELDTPDILHDTCVYLMDNGAPT